MSGGKKGGGGEITSPPKNFSLRLKLIAVSTRCIFMPTTLRSIIPRPTKTGVKTPGIPGPTHKRGGVARANPCKKCNRVPE